MDLRARHPALRAVVEGLIGALGPGYFVEVHHWDGDSPAVGLARPDDPDVLVCIAVTPGTETVFYECEVPSDAPDQCYEVASRKEKSDLEELLAVVRPHLAANA